MKEIKDLGFGVIQVNETKPTISKMESVDNYLCKWQKLKEWLKKEQGYTSIYEEQRRVALEEILEQMQELEGEDVED